jgi:S-adenosylmethionine:diacylglycerol 3-amino-3-carboxypropyl transferase
MSASENDIKVWQSDSAGKDGKIQYGQVREDARAEGALLRKLRNDARVVAVCSGGCTALSLLTIGESRVTAIDSNPAQIYLTELKAKALTTLDFEPARTFFNEDASELPNKIGIHLTDASKQYWLKHRQELKAGLVNCGTADHKIKGSRDLFHMSVHPATKTETMLSQTNMKAQTNMFNNEWVNWQWKLALKSMSSKANLAAGAGDISMQSVPKDFAEQVQKKIERSFTNFISSGNAYLWQYFLGRYPMNNEEALPPYLRRSNLLFLRNGLSRFTLAAEDLVTWLKEQPSESLDYFVLSNILDFSKGPYAAILAEEIARVGRSGGIVCLRSLLPRTEAMLADHNRRLIFDANISKEIEATDQGPFCNFIQVFGIK